MVIVGRTPQFAYNLQKRHAFKLIADRLIVGNVIANNPNGNELIQIVSSGRFGQFLKEVNNSLHLLLQSKVM